MTCHWGNHFEVEGEAARDQDDPDPIVLYRVATPGYFDALGIRLVRGRFFNETDGRGAGRRAIIVNEAFVRQFLPGVADPVGKHVRFRGNSDDAWMTVVGVASDVKHYGMDEPMIPGAYLPLGQLEFGSATMRIALRSRADANGMVVAARRVLRELDADLPMYEVGTMEGALRRSFALRETYAWLLSVFAVAALLLALGGIYGVTSYGRPGACGRSAFTWPLARAEIRWCAWSCGAV